MLTASERRRPPMAHAYGLWLSFEANTFGEATNEIICGLSRASSFSHAHHSRIAEPKSILLLTTAKLHVLFFTCAPPLPVPRNREPIHFSIVPAPRSSLQLPSRSRARVLYQVCRPFPRCSRLSCALHRQAIGDNALLTILAS